MNNEVVLKIFGQNIRELRLAKKYSQDRLALLAGLHRTYISDVERGARNISLFTIVRLANALETPITSLFPQYLQDKI